MRRAVHTFHVERAVAVAAQSALLGRIALMAVPHDCVIDGQWNVVAVVCVCVLVTLAALTLVVARNCLLIWPAALL